VVDEVDDTSEDVVVDGTVGDTGVDDVLLKLDKDVELLRDSVQLVLKLKLKVKLVVLLIDEEVEENSDDVELETGKDVVELETTDDDEVDGIVGEAGVDEMVPELVVELVMLLNESVQLVLKVELELDTVELEISDDEVDGTVDDTDVELELLEIDSELVILLRDSVQVVLKLELKLKLVELVSD
jgi:hypothetical protein